MVARTEGTAVCAETHVERQNVPFIVILSERSESKDLRTIDTAKILRLPPVAQDDWYLQLYEFALIYAIMQSVTAGRVKTLPYMMEHCQRA